MLQGVTMSKILYIEDELTHNLQTIKKLFYPMLDRQTLATLAELEKKKTITTQDITSAFQNLTTLDICNSLPEALSKIIAHHRDYDLFVIDRNLSANAYAKAAQTITDLLTQLDFPHPAEQIAQYHGREGDLLLLILLRINRDYRDKLFLLTIYTPESLKSMQEFQDVLEVTDFRTDRIIEKGSVHEAMISQVMTDLPAFAIQNQYRTECSILRKWFNENEVNLYVESAKCVDKEDRKIDFLQKVRPILEKLLVTLAKKIHENNARYWEDGAEPNLRVMEFVKSLDYIDTRWGIDYNNVVKQCLFSIWKISSDYGNHPNANPDDVTLYTVKALFYQINDVILWFDTAMENVIKQLHKR